MITKFIGHTTSFLARPRNLFVLGIAGLIILLGSLLTEQNLRELSESFTVSFREALRGINAIEFATIFKDQFSSQWRNADDILDTILFGLPSALRDFKREGGGTNWLFLAYFLFVMPVALIIASVTTTYYSTLALLTNSSWLGIMIFVLSFAVLIVLYVEDEKRSEKVMFKRFGHSNRPKSAPISDNHWLEFSGVLWGGAIVIPFVVLLTTVISLALYYLLIGLTFVIGPALTGLFNLAFIVAVIIKILSTSDQLEQLWAHWTSTPVPVPLTSGPNVSWLVENTLSQVADNSYVGDKAGSQARARRTRPSSYEDEPSMLIRSFKNAFYYRHGVYCVALSPDGTKIAATGRKDRGGDLVTYVFDFKTGRCLAEIVTANTASYMYAWEEYGELTKGKWKDNPPGFDPEIFFSQTARTASLSFSPDGRFLQINDDVHDLEATNVYHAPGWYKHCSAIESDGVSWRSAEMSNDQPANEKNAQEYPVWRPMVRSYSFETGEFSTERDNSDAVYAINGKMFAKYYSDDYSNPHVQIFDAGNGNLLETLAMSASNSAGYFFSPDCKYFLMIGGDEGQLEFYDTEKFQHRRSLEVFPRCAAISVNGDCIVTGGMRDGDINVWHFGSFGLQSHYDYKPNEYNALIRWRDFLIMGFSSLRGKSMDHPTDVVVDDQYHVSVGDLGKLMLREIGGDQSVHKIAAHRGQIGHLLTAPNGRILTSGRRDGFVRRWNAKTAEVEHEVRPPAKWRTGVSALATDPQNKYLLIGYKSGHLQICALEDFRSLLVHKAHSSAVTRLEFESRLPGDCLTSRSFNAFRWLHTTRTWDISRLSELTNEVS